MLVLIGLFLVIFLAMAALSVDVAYMHLSRTQLRTATDAAARAGGEALSRLQNTGAARDAAKSFAAANLVAGEPLKLADSDIVFGNSTPQADGSWQFTPGGMPTNSLKVLGQRTRSSLSGPVSLFFGRIFNVYDFQPVQSASVVKLDRDICLVIDRSSSMKLSLSSTDEGLWITDPRFGLPPQIPDSRWAAAANAVDVFVDTLDSTSAKEQCALVSFASDFAWLNVTNLASKLDQELAPDLSKIKKACHDYDKILFNGMTNTAAGLDAGIAELTDGKKSRPYASKTMIFLTDGFRTAGGDPLDSARVAAANHIVIHTVTFGAVFDRTEMIAVASATGGKSYHAPDAQSLTDIFHEIAVGTNVLLTN
jgi:hypothetical protein